MDITIEHDEKRRQFQAIAGESVGTLDYGEVEEGILDYRSTFVRPTHRGRGIAARLTRHALDYAAERGAKVVPSCWYVAQYMDRNPEYADLRHAG